MFCRNCGNSLPPGALFCGVCGTRVEAVEPAAAESAQNFVQEQVAAPVEQAQEFVQEQVAAPVEQAQEFVQEQVAAPVEQAQEFVQEQVAAPVEQAQQAVEEQTSEVAQNVAAAAAVVASTENVIEQAQAAPVQQAAQQYVQQPVQQAAQQYVQQPVEQAAQQYVQQPVEQVAQQYVQQPVQQAAQQYVQQPVEQAAQQYVQQPVQQAAQQYVQQPVEQTAQQYVQQPVQQFAQPYAQPYAQNVYNQPTEKKKKSKLPKILLIILIILVVLAGGLIAYLTFLDKNGIKEIAGINLNVLDFTQMPKDDAEKFGELVNKVDKAFANISARNFRKAIPEYAVPYVCKSFNCVDEDDLLDYFFSEELSKCGSNITVDETYAMKYEIEDTGALESAFEKNFGEKVTISKAYLVENACKYEGSDGSTRIKDTYIFFNDGTEWQLILLAPGGAGDFGID